MPLKREKGERRLNIQLPVGLSPLCVPPEGDEQEGVAAGRPPDRDVAERTRGWSDMEDFREIPALLAAGPRAVHSPAHSLWPNYVFQQIAVFTKCAGSSELASAVYRPSAAAVHSWRSARGARSGGHTAPHPGPQGPGAQAGPATRPSPEAARGVVSVGGGDELRASDL